MANPNAVNAWLEDCRQIALEADSLGNETSKLINAWQVVDKIRMEDCIQSMYHMSWNLKDIAENIDEITREHLEAKRKYSIEDIQYGDAKQMEVSELEERTVAWYRDCDNFYHLLRRVVQAVAGFGFNPRTVALLTARVKLDIDFFRRQYEKSGGRLQ